MADTILSLARNPPQDPLERKKLYDAARTLMLQTEDQFVTTHRIFFSGFQLIFADIAGDLGIFTTLVKDPKRLWTVAELTSQFGCSEILLARVLRGLAAYGMVSVNADGQYGPAQATYTLADPMVAGCVRHNVISVNPCVNKLPEFLRKTHHQNPSDLKAGAGQLAFNTDQDMFQWLGSHPENLKYAIINMQGQRTGQQNWLTNPKLFPSEFFHLSPNDLTSSRPLLVDIGSGAGQQSIAFRNAHPSLPGKIIIQDLPHTISGLDRAFLANLNIEPMEHDFTAEQPVKGAKVYYLRNIMHDWPDARCCLILSKLRAAMAPDSLLVVDELVVKEPEAQWQQVNYDMVMMGVLSGMERTAKQWAEIFRATGFAIKEVREYDEDNGDSLIVGVPV